MVGWGRHRSPADRARTLAAIEIDILVRGTWSEPLSDAILPSAAKVEQDPLDNDARDRINVAEHPKARPLDDSRRRRESTIRID